MRATRACGYASACSSAAATGRTSSLDERADGATIGVVIGEGDSTMKSPMPLDDLVLALQRRLDRLVRRLRLGPRARAPASAGCSIVQIDGLSRAVLEQRAGRGAHAVPARGCSRAAGYRSAPDVGRAADLHAGLPDGRDVRRAARTSRASTTTTSAGGRDVYFPRARRRRPRRGAPGRRPARHRAPAAARTAASSRAAPSTTCLTFAMLKRPAGAGLLRARRPRVIVLAWVLVKSVVDLGRRDRRARCSRLIADPCRARRAAGSWLVHQDRHVGVDPRALHARRPRATSTRGVPAIYVNYLDYDVFAHAWGPRHRARAARAARGRPLDPAALARRAARARAPLRPLRAVRPRAGALHARTIG